LGCGMHGNSYAADHAKNFKKQAIGSGVVIGGLELHYHAHPIGYIIDITKSIL